MEKIYVCVSNGVNKETKKPYSKFSALVETDNMAFINLKDNVYEQERVPLFTKRILKG